MLAKRNSAVPLGRARGQFAIVEVRIPRPIQPFLQAGYPSLPVDGIDAVARWAETTYGSEWRSVEAPAPQH
jgi:hypothetical protein